MTYELIKSDLVFQGRVFQIQHDLVRLPNGRQVYIDMVVHRDAVTILPVDEAGCIVFIRQFRYAIGKNLLELPAGMLEEGESPEMGAGRELREETGLAAGRLKNLGGFHLAPGYSTEYLHVFLATELTPAPLPGDEDEDIQIEKIPVAQAYQLVEEGAIDDAKSLAALLLARSYLLGE